MKDFLLSYDTVTLRPRHSKLSSRSKADTSLMFCGRKFNLPIVPANMEDTIDIWRAKQLSESDYFYIYHRFGQENEFHPQLKTSSFVKVANEENWKLISVSIGTKEYSSALSDSLKSGHRIDFITIDVAHADHEDVKEAVNYVRRSWPKSKLIVGNVATGEGAEYLVRLGIDAIKVGIGGGSICTTRFMTGFHIPTLQSVLEIETRLTEIGYPVPIIADGGAVHYGDIAKSLTFGATMVMSGRWFASCIDSPAKIVDGKKLYRGSTSYESKGTRKHIEGKTLELQEGFTYIERLEEISQALKSSISYAGGNDLSTFDRVQWQRVFPTN